MKNEQRAIEDVKNIFRDRILEKKTLLKEEKIRGGFLKKSGDDMVKRFWSIKNLDQDPARTFNVIRDANGRPTGIQSPKRITLDDAFFYRHYDELMKKFNEALGVVVFGIVRLEEQISEFGQVLNLVNRCKTADEIYKILDDFNFTISGPEEELSIQGPTLPGSLCKNGSMTIDISLSPNGELKVVRQ